MTCQLEISSYFTAVYQDYIKSCNFRRFEIKTMTEIKIFSLYGQFILEQRIIAAGLKKYEMVNRTTYIFKAIT